MADGDHVLNELEQLKRYMEVNDSELARLFGVTRETIFRRRQGRKALSRLWRLAIVGARTEWGTQVGRLYASPEEGGCTRVELLEGLINGQA